MTERRAVITGVGGISPNGRTYRENMDAAWAGQSVNGLETDWLKAQTKPAWLLDIHQTLFEAAELGNDEVAKLLIGEEKNGKRIGGILGMIPGYDRLRSKVAGRIVPEYDILADSDYPFKVLIAAKDLPREYNATGILALRATAEATDNAGILDDYMQLMVDTKRTAVVIGSGIGGALLLADGAYKLLQNKRPGAKDLYQMMPENPVITVASHFGAEGAHAFTSKACNSSNGALAQAIRLIKLGEADVVLAGGAEALSYYTIAEFEASGAAYEEDDPTAAPRPFDKRRNGTAVGEGSFMFVVEDEEHARQRGATILGLLSGYGEMGGPGERTELVVDHLYGAVALALERANWTRDLADSTVYMAHGTGTKLGDPGEIEVVEYLNERLGVKLEGYVTQSKGTFNHTLGDASAAAAGMCLEMIRTQSLPPAVGSVDVEDRMKPYMTAHDRVIETDVNTAINAGAGFGNQNGGVIIERYEI